MSAVQVLQHFKTMLLDFIDDLIEQFPTEGKLVVGRIFVDSLSTEEIIKQFIKEVLPYEKMINKKDEAFFLTHDILLAGITNSEVSHFKHLYLQLDEDSKNTVWQWVQCLVSITKKYQEITSSS